MKLILKYIKPFTILVIISLAFLFCQAMTDLSLPTLMSDIVDIGISKNGIKEISPKELSANGFDSIKIFMNSEEGEIFTEAYTADGDTLIQKKLSDEKLSEIDGIYGRASMAFVNFLKNSMADEKGSLNTQLGQQGEISEISMEDIDIKAFYPMIPMFTQIKEQGLIDPYIEEAKNYDSMLPEQMGNAFTQIFYRELGYDLSAMQNSYVMRKGLEMLGIAFLGIVAAIIVGFIASRISASVGEKLRRDIFEKVENFSNSEFDKFSTASLITRTTNDVQQVQMLIGLGLKLMCYAPILGIGGIIMALNKSMSLSWIIAVAVTFLLGLIIVIFTMAVPKFKILQKLTDKINLVSRENLSGMLVIRAFGNEKYEEERFDGVNRDLASTNQFIQRVMAFMMPAMMVIMNVVSLTIVWVGAHAIAESTLQVGSMMAFIQYTMQIIMAFIMMAMIFIMVPRAAVSIVRINEVLETELVIKEVSKENEKHITEKKVTVSFEDVFFRYANAESDVLENIALTAKPGETTAFIGSTGSGKSTIINLIPRFYDVTKGTIKFNGIDIRELPQEELRSLIGYVPQKGILFSGDIESNIKYGKEDASAEEIAKAIEVAQAKDFVESTELGTETPISQGGTNVSGGQKQRLSIARALVNNPPVYIFDDSFSALDFKTDASLRKALKQYTADATVFIVAQRISTIMAAEQIVVLDEGKIMGIGTHRELLENCPTYREIAESQLAKEELE